MVTRVRAKERPRSADRAASQNRMYVLFWRREKRLTNNRLELLFTNKIIAHNDNL